MKSMERMFNK